MTDGFNQSVRERAHIAQCGAYVDDDELVAAISSNVFLQCRMQNPAFAPSVFGGPVIQYTATSS